MKSFANYAASRNLAEFLVENEIDANNFCDMVLESLSKESINEENLNEFVQKLARGISGIFGGAAGAAGDAAGAVGSGARRGASAVGGALGSAASAVGGALSSAAGAVGGAAQAAGRYVGDKYEASRRAEALRQVKDRLGGLENALVSLGLDKSQVSAFLGKLNDHLQSAIVKGKMGTIQKASDVRSQERARQQAGGHEAWKGMETQQAAQARGVERYRNEFGTQPSGQPVS